MLRREFLRIGLSGSVALSVAACSQTPDFATAQSPDAPQAVPLPDDAAWQRFSQQFSGEILRPAHPDYQRCYPPANSRYDDRKPVLILRPGNSHDVQLTLNFVRQFKLPLVVRAGGHSYTGLSSGSGILLDTSSLQAISYQDGVATIGAGARLGQVYATLGQWQQSIPAGSCASVGLAGLLTGGGLGIADREFGLTCDALLEAELVTADGTIRTVSATQHADLFWALRGCGGGQFGVLTQLKMQTFATAPVRNYIARYPLKDGELVLKHWQQWAAQLPDTVWTQLAIWINGTVSAKPEIQIRCCGIGHPAAVTSAWQQLELRLAGLWGDIDMQDHQYLDFMLSDCKNMEQQQCQLPQQHPDGRLKRVAMAGSSDMFGKPLDKAASQTLLKALRQLQQQGGTGAVLLTLMGGAIGRLPVHDSAFAHRHALFSAQYLTIYPAQTAEQTIAAGAQWCHQMRVQMRRWSTGGAYLNYSDGLLRVPSRAYYGSHYRRLQQIKRQYDPDNLFRQFQGISG